jgi:hypothetical protein
MRHQWYADARDLIKWGALIHLAEEQDIKRIIQVAYLRPDVIRPKLQLGNNSIEMPVVVWSHFRNLNDIKRLAKSSGIKIDLFSTPYNVEDRLAYSEAIARQYRAIKKEWPAIVFLDPDTGIAERNTKPVHVTPDEVRRIWGALSPESWLVLYQHRFRHKKWQLFKRSEFAKAIDLRQGKIMTIEVVPVV